MRLGGYQILDLKQVKLETGIATEIKGLAVQINGNPYGKRWVVSGLNLDGKIYPDIELPFINSSGTYSCDYDGWTISIADDEVTATKKEE